MISMRQWTTWLRMAVGRSPQHAPQPPGPFWTAGALGGYYSDLRRKAEQPSRGGVPVSRCRDGRTVVFPIAVAQYGLGAYDRHLESGAESDLQAALACADWFLANQDDRGGWDTWARVGMACTNPYSGMTQGEAVSLLLRVYKVKGDERYLAAAERAVDLMLTPTTEGGVKRLEGGLAFFEERVEEVPATVLNGWLFALFGLYDASLVTGRSRYREELGTMLESLRQSLSGYDLGFWSAYDLRVNVASPFYHSLHVALLEVGGRVFADPALSRMAERWRSYGASRKNKAKAVALKIAQKLASREEAPVYG